MAIIALAVLPAQAEVQWVETSIDHFSSEKGIPTWTDETCRMLNARIDIPKTQLADFSDVAVNNDNECVRFNWKGSTYFVRLTSVTLKNAPKATISACRSALAAQAIAPNSRSSATMGSSPDVKAGDCK